MNAGPTRVIGAEFLLSAPDIRHAPEHDLTEIAVTGRSNVGKSSLINALCNNRKLAKISKTPGKTRMINFFRVRVRDPDFSFCLVDLPGYGFAKVSKTEQERWGSSIELFLQKRANLVAIGQLIDARHPPTKLDLQMREWLSHSPLEVITVLTKADKIKRSELEQTRRRVTQMLLSAGDPAPVLFSATKRWGVEELCAIIAEMVDNQNRAESRAVENSNTG